jgi:hypothetical protein
MIIVFILALNILMGLITFLMNSEEVYVVKGMVPGNVSKTIQVDPNKKGTVAIDRSNNKSGIEFSWSTWINITDLDLNKSTYLHVFNKGEQTFSSTGLNSPNNSPGMYLKYNPTTKLCELHVLMNTYNTGSSYYDEITVPNFPIGKWVNVIIRITNKNFDVYVNGSLAMQHQLIDVPHQNYGSVNVGSNGGFNGYISDLMYFSYAISPGKIIAINKRGPNLKMNENSAALGYAPNYLSSQWYSDNIQL